MNEKFIFRTIGTQEDVKDNLMEVYSTSENDEVLKKNLIEFFDSMSNGIYKAHMSLVISQPHMKIFQLSKYYIKERDYLNHELLIFEASSNDGLLTINRIRIHRSILRG